MSLKRDVKYFAGMDLDVIGERLRVRRDGSSDSEYRQKILSRIEREEGGGPAFGEFNQAGDCSIKTGGLTVRDYFAAKAMQSILALGDSYDYEGAAIDELPRHAYALADAMLRERAK